MKFYEAQTELRRILKDQTTVYVPKLRRLLQSLNISVSEEKPTGLVDQTAVEVLKTKNGRPTVIEWQGQTYRLQIESLDKTKKWKGPKK